MARKRLGDLTPRQREWLGHLRSCRQRGETIRAYARRHRLSESALYQAAKDLRQRGVLPAATRRRHSGTRRGAKPRAPFVEVSAAVPASGPRAWRARLPNGVVLEGGDALGPELLEALARL